MKVIETIRDFAKGVKDVAKEVMAIAIPVAGIMIALDIVVGTTFGVLQRLTTVLAAVGVSGNLLTVILVAGLVVWYSEKKKA